MSKRIIEFHRGAGIPSANTVRFRKERVELLSRWAAEISERSLAIMEHSRGEDYDLARRIRITARLIGGLLEHDQGPCIMSDAEKGREQCRRTQTE